MTQAQVREPVKCDRPGCQVRFVPAHKNHKFCSTRCKRSCQNYRFALNSGQRA